MSQVAISGNASGTGTLTIAAPNTNSNYTLTLPEATTTIVGTDATQTLTNKTIQGGVITRGTAVASTSGTSIDFTSIPSWVKRITVMFSGVSTSGTSHVLIQIGTSGTPTTSGYSSAGSYVNITGSNVGGATSTAGFIIFFSNATYVNSGNFTITNISGNNWTFSGILSNLTTATYTGQSAGSGSLSGTLNIVRVTTVNGTDTFDAGTINILYEG